MSRNFSKRLTALKLQSDDSSEGRLGFRKALFLSIIASLAVLILLRQIVGEEALLVPEVKPVTQSGDVLSDLETRLDNAEAVQARRQQASIEDLTWQQQIERDVSRRYVWLETTVFGKSAAERYLSFAESVLSGLGTAGEKKEVEEAVEGEEENLLDFSSWFVGLRRSIANIALRVGFLVLSFWPVWLVVAVLSYFISTAFFRPVKTDDVLGVCNPHKGPFYSGLWGPFQPNNSISGTDFASPGLACPSMVKKQVAQRYKAYGLLKKYHALNETNLGLLQVILAYGHYPSYVPEEKSVDDREREREADGEEGSEPTGPMHENKNPDAPTIEKETPIGLQAVLEAYVALQRCKETLESQGVSGEQRFEAHQKLLTQLTEQVSPLGAILLNGLTPTRANALMELPIASVATAYLSTEAGKALVFEEVSGGNFAQESLFPNLQARAVMHSIPAYVREYNGDVRLQIRQALVTSRRHGDFGRAFLPVNMTKASRALRDWLEVLYTAEGLRAEASSLVELDAHIDEIHQIWRKELTGHVREELGNESAHLDRLKDSASHLWLGLPYKSVVLTPLRSVVRLALTAVSETRKQRIIHLIEDTRARQANVSISAGLPGFKRQAVEAEQGDIYSSGVTKELAEDKETNDLAIRWMLVRRMLTRYNWLSTRVGDDAVPVDGLLKGLVAARVQGESPNALTLDSLVPLRARRFRLLFGEGWERDFYANSPKDGDIKVVMDSSKFEESKRAFERRLIHGDVDPEEAVAS